MAARGKTRWFNRNVNPTQLGFYECVARRAGMPHYSIMSMEWDGEGFINTWHPMPVIISRWRGATEKAYNEAVAKGLQ